MESDNEASREGQAGSDPGKQVEDQAGSDPGKQVKGRAGSDPGVAADSQIQPSHVVHVGPNLEHMNLEENLKLPTEGEVRLEGPASSAGTLSSMQNLGKELSFTNQFLVEKSQEDEPEKTNTEVEVQSMVMVPIHQDPSSVPLMTSPIIDLTVSQPAFTTVQASIPTSTATVTTTTTTTFPPPPPQPQQGISNSIIIQWIGELEQSIADLVEENQTLEERLDKQGNRMHQLETQDLSGMIKEQIMEYMRTQEVDQKIYEMMKEVITASVQYAMRAPLRAHFKDLPTSDMKEILLQRMLEDNYDKGHEDHKIAYEALQKSILRDESEQFDADKAEKLKKTKRKQDSPKTPPGSPPPPPPPPPPSGPSGASGTTRASDSAQDPLPPPSSPTTNQGDQSQGSDAPGSSKTAASTAYTAWTMTTSRFEPSTSSIPEDVFMHEESDVEAQDLVFDDEDIDSSYVPPPENYLLSQTGDIGGFIDWFCKKQGITELKMEHLEGPVYEVVKAFHPDVIHLQFQMEECHKLLTNQVDDVLLRHNVSRPLPVGSPPGQVTIQTKFFFNNNLEYLRFYSKGNRLVLSMTKIKAAHYPDAGLEQMVPDQMWIKEECMYDILETYGLEFMHDYKILDSPRAVLFKDKYGMQMLMRFNKIHKFNDGTLQQIDEALDYQQAVYVFHSEEAKVQENLSELGKLCWYEFPQSRQIRRDLPRDKLLVSVEVLRYDYKRSNVNKGIVRTEMELVLEHTQQGTSNEVLVGPYGFEGSYKDEDGVNLFQQSQVHSYMLILKTQ
ncbi:hypothetical protein Tco_0454912 [Tanacetum coccineum]